MRLQIDGSPKFHEWMVDAHNVPMEFYSATLSAYLCFGFINPKIHLEYFKKFLMLKVKFIVFHHGNGTYNHGIHWRWFVLELGPTIEQGKSMQT